MCFLPFRNTCVAENMVTAYSGDRLLRTLGIEVFAYHIYLVAFLIGTKRLGDPLLYTCIVIRSFRHRMGVVSKRAVECVNIHC